MVKGTLLAKLCFGLIFFILSCSVGQSQSFSFSLQPESIGIITSVKTGQRVGTGFVAGSSNRVITCAHVIAIDDDYFYEPVRTESPLPNTKRGFPLKLEYALPRYDLAVLSSSENVVKKPLDWSDFRRLRPGDRVIYAGWVFDTNSLRVDVATISAIGSVLNDNAVIEFLEFEGVGKPGYSGGPVFDMNGNIVAIMREAWTKRGVKGGKEMLINRAFSTDILSVITKQVFVKASENLKR